MAQAIGKQSIFLWEGKNRRGEVVRGRQSGPSEMVVKAQLRRQGITPTQVRVQSTRALKRGRSKIKPLDIALFTRQLATMMAAGVPLVQGFDIVARGSDKPALRSMLLGIKTDVESGTALADALAAEPVFFDELFVNLVAAGERSGALETLLDKIATYREKAEALKAKVRKALTYPAVITAVALIVTGILLYFVVPQFEGLFGSFGADLPAFTRLVISLSEFVQTWWWLILLALAAAGTAIVQLNRRSPGFRAARDKYILRVPVIGSILYKAALARYARTLATMFTAGVPLVDALTSVAGATGNILFSRAVLRIRDQVATGEQLHRAMQQTEIFPHMAVQMIAIGEESGALDTMAIKVAEFYEAEVDDMVDNLSALLEPLIMVVLGVLVGGLVTAMYLPIFQMGQVI
ncbi:MAG: type II secretion system F family protein [Pseudomonadota bacterium]|nr:type II secretion system F family protein [Pseudomonadota bacterium]